jgi:molecular chaperone DnaJ
MAVDRDYYEILGVPRDASDAEIKKAFRKLAQRWHPDVSEEPDAHDRFKEINEAYQVLADPQRRQQYDLFGRAGLGDLGAGFETGFPGFADIFDAFFGGGVGTTRRGRPMAGSDLRYDLRISFAEAVHGTEKEIDFVALDRCETCGGSGAAEGAQPITCPTCSGRGEVRTVRQTMLGQMVNVSTCPRCRGEGKVVEKRCDTCQGEGRIQRKRTLRVRIPAGIDEGHQVRLSGQGEVGPRGGPAGSLYVAVHVTPHPSLKREGTELYHEADVPMAGAALGTTITVPTAEGDEQVEIKPGTQPGTEIRLRARGVPHVRRPSVRGDLHVLVRVVVPTRLSKRERELLAELAAERGDFVKGHDPGLIGRVRDALG